MSKIKRMEISFESGDKHITHVIDGEEFKLYMMMLEATGPNLLIQNPHVKKLVEALRNVDKIPMPSKVVHGSYWHYYCFKTIQEKKEKALAEWEGE